MAFDLSVVGKKSCVHRHAYRWKDVALYALAVGAGEDELAYVDPGGERRVLPTYAVVPTLEPCRELLGRLAGGFANLVHRYQRLVVHEPMAPEGEVTTVGEIVHVAGRGAMAEVSGRTWTHDAGGRLVAETEFSVVYRVAGVPEGPGAPRRPKHRPPPRPADFCASERTWPMQSLLYGLNGDNNPIHFDAAAARAIGFARPILHGLCTFGYVGRVVGQQAAAHSGAPRKLVELEAEFRKPAFPGDTLTVSGWREEPHILLHVATSERPDDAVLGNVRAVLAPGREPPGAST